MSHMRFVYERDEAVLIWLEPHIKPASNELQKAAVKRGSG